MFLLKGPIMAIQNLTRIYIFNLPFEERNFGRSTVFFPLAGLVIGVFLSAIYLAGAKVFPATVVAALLIAGHLIITGGLHLDGLMDSMDGLFSGRDRERKLEIMKDSRVGANGVMGVFVLLLLKFSLFIYLASFDNYSIIAVLVVTTTLSRWSMVYAIRFFPYFRKEGLGKLYKLHTGNKEFVWGTILALVIAVILLKLKALILFFLIWLITYFMARKITETIGGMTGDTYGAIMEINEVLLLLIMLTLI